MLINTFVNSIYLFDDKALVNFNYKDGTETINFSEVECALKQRASLTGSDLEILSPPHKKASTSRRCLFMWYKRNGRVRHWPPEKALLSFGQKSFFNEVAPDGANEE